MVQQPVSVPVTSPRFKATLAKHAAFWRRGDNSLLRSVGVFAASVPVPLPQADGSVIMRCDRLQPHMIDAATMVAQAAHWDAAAMDTSPALRGEFLISIGMGDLIPTSRPIRKIPWLEAMLGCPVKMTEGQIWSEPYEGDPEEIIRRGVNFEHNPWFQLYLEFLRLLQERVSDQFPTSANTLLRGNCDLVAAILGVQEACLGWLERPAFMSRLLRVCADAILAVIEGGYKVLKPFQGGYMSAYGVWAPAPVLLTQADHSTLLSPQMYAEQILPFDLEVIRALPVSIVHLHNPGLHVAPHLVQVPELGAIEVVVDPYPHERRKPYEVKMLQMIQQHKPLLLDVNFPSWAEAEWLLSQLSPRGLTFNARFDQAVFATLPAGLPGSETWLLA